MSQPDRASAEPDRGLVRAVLVLLVIVIGAVLSLGIVRFLGTAEAACVVVLASIVAAYVLLPLVTLLRRWMPMAAALLLAYVTFALGLALVVWILVPPLINQAQQLAVSLPGLVAQLQHEVANRDSPFMSKFPPNVQTWIQSLPGQLGLLISKYAFSIAQRTFVILTSAVSVSSA